MENFKESCCQMAIMGVKWLNSTFCVLLFFNNLLAFWTLLEVKLRVYENIPDGFIAYFVICIVKIHLLFIKLGIPIKCFAALVIRVCYYSTCKVSFTITCIA